MITRARLTTGSLVGVLLLVATPAAAQRRGPGLFAGTFSVTSNTTVSVTSPITTTESRVTHERAEVRAGSRGDLAIHVTNERGERCVLEGNLSSETSVSLLGGQRCAMTDPVRNLRMNLTLRSGSGSISGSHLSLRMSWGVATSAGFIDVTGTASQETVGNRTGGGPVVAAPTQPVGAVPMVAPQQPPVVMAPPVPAYGLDPVPTTGRSRRGRRGRSDSTEGVVMTGAIPVTPTPVAQPAPAQNDAPIWGLPTDLSTGAPVPVSATPAPMAPAPMAPASATPAPMAPAPMAPTPMPPAPMAPAPMAPAPMAPAPVAPAANTPAPLWGAAPSSSAPAPSSAPMFGSAQPAPTFGAPQPAAAPMFGSAQPSAPAPAATGSWGGLGAPQAGAARTQPTAGGSPLVSFGAQPGAAQSAGGPPAFGTTQPAPYGAAQPAPYGAMQPAPYGAMQPAPYGAMQPAPYGSPQPGAAPYGYPQPAPAAAPLVQFGGQRGAAPSGWGAGAPTQPAMQPGMQPVPTPGAPRPLVMFSVTNGPL